jgi:predicted peroxiredoxin
MAEKLLIIMVNTDPQNPSELSAPFFQATVAAAMEYEVEVILTGRSGELAVKGVAENIPLPNDISKTIYTVIQEAHKAGVKFKVCAPILDQWGGEMIPEIEETVGGAYIISEAMDSGTVTFNY